MVRLAELLVVTTDRLKIVRIRAENVPRVGPTRGHKRSDDESLAPGRRRSCVLDETQK